MLADISHDKTLEVKTLGGKANLANDMDANAQRWDPITPQELASLSWILPWAARSYNHYITFLKIHGSPLVAIK